MDRSPGAAATNCLAACSLPGDPEEQKALRRTPFGPTIAPCATDQHVRGSGPLNSKVTFVMIFAACLVCGTDVMAEKKPRLAPELRSNFGQSNVNVIVQFTDVLTARHDQKVHALGGTLQHRLNLIKAGSYSIPAAALHTLADDPEVAYISPDRHLSGTKSGASTVAALDYHTDTVNAPAAWSRNLNGSGVGVAVIDSGITTTPDLNGQNIVFSQNFVASSGSANDQFGHGSHVAGIIAGTGKKSSGTGYIYTFKGIADGVNLINLRVLDQNGAGTDSQVIAAIDMAIQLKSKYNIRVINLSLGRPVYESY